MIPNLNNSGIFNEQYIPHFNQNAMDVDHVIVPPPIHTGLLLPQDKALREFFQKTFLIEYEKDIAHLHSHLSNQPIERLFDFIKEAIPKVTVLSVNQKWIGLFRCIFQIIEERIALGIALGFLLNDTQVGSLDTFYNLNKDHIPELTDEQGYPIWLLLYRFHYCIMNVQFVKREETKNRCLQIINQQFLKPMQSLKISSIAILNFLRFGPSNTKFFKEIFQRKPDVAFNILRFLKKCQRKDWTQLLLIPENIDSAEKLIEFFGFINLQERQKLVEKLFKNVKFLSGNDIVLTDYPEQNLATILALMDNISILRLEQSKSNPKKRELETTSETEQSVSKFAKITENGKGSAQNGEIAVVNQGERRSLEGIYPFGKLPRCLKVLDLTKISKINLYDLGSLQPKTKLHLKLSTASEFDFNIYQPWPQGTLIDIEWDIQQKKIPPVSLFPNVHHFLHVGELNESDPILLGIIRDMPGMISFQIDSKLDELALPILEKFPILPRIYITKKNLQKSSLLILESLLVKNSNLTIEVDQKILFKDLFSNGEILLKDISCLYGNVWEQNVTHYLNKKTPHSLGETQNARFLFEVFLMFVRFIPESARHHYFAIGLSLGSKINLPINPSYGDIILEAFESLFVSKSPNRGVLLYWAIEILKFPPPMAEGNVPIINYCFDLCFSYFAEDSTFFNYRQVLRKKMMQEPLSCYLLHYLAEEKKGHLRLLELELEYSVSHLLKQEYPAFSLVAWNKVFDRLYRMTPNLGAFYPQVQEPKRPGHYQAANFFIANRIYDNSLQMAMVVDICLAQDVMSEDQIAYCKQYIFHKQASNLGLSKLLSEEIFQELVLKRLIDLLEKTVTHEEFVKISSMFYNASNYDNLYKSFPLLLAFFNRISDISSDSDLSTKFYSFIRGVVKRLEESPDLYQTYPNLARYLINFYFPIYIKKEEREHAINQSPFFIKLLRRIDADAIPIVLEQLQTVLHPKIQDNITAPKLHESGAYQLILDHIGSLKHKIELLKECLRSIREAFNQDPNFLKSSSQKFIENISELMLYQANYRGDLYLFSYSPIATLIIDRLQQQTTPIQLKRKSYLAVAILSIGSLLKDETQKYCLEIIQKNYDISLTGFPAHKVIINSDNVLFIEGLFQFLFSDASTLQTMPNTMVWLQMLARNGFFEKSVQLLIKLKEKKILQIKNLYEYFYSGQFSEEEKAKISDILDKEEKQQLFSMSYKIDLSSSFDNLKRLVKPEQTRIEVPTGAENLNLNGFLPLLEGLKLGDHDSPIDVKAFYTDKLEKPEDFKVTMARLLINIQTRNPKVYGVPKNPEQRELFYREIEDGYKTSLSIILEGIRNNKKEIMEDYPVFLLRMCDAGSKCAKDYQDSSRESYCNFTRKKIKFIFNVENQLLNVLHDFAWNCAKKVAFKTLRGTLAYAAFVKFWESLLGPQNGSLQILQEEDGINAQFMTIMDRKQEHYQQFSLLFTVDTCLEMLYQHFNATANEKNGLAYNELFKKYGLSEEEAWGEMVDEPRYGLRKLLEKWAIIIPK